MRNTITLTIDGYAARDAEIKYTPQGTAVTEALIPYTPRRLNQQTQQWEDAGETTWVTASFWDKDAEAPSRQSGRAPPSPSPECPGSAPTPARTGSPTPPST